MNILAFRALVRTALSGDVAASWEAQILSYQYALATPEQQAACVAAVTADIAAAESKGGEG